MSVTDFDKTVVVGEGEAAQEVSFLTEVKFAMAMYERASDGMEDTDMPDPATWLANGELLTHNWELKKMELVGIKEDSKTKLEEKDRIHTFLTSAIGLYLDLICSIYVTFKDHINSNKEALLQLSKKGISD